MSLLPIFRAALPSLIFTVIASSAMAASFDCATARSSREKMICNDRELSRLDAQLGHDYAEKRALLSSHGAELLLQSQRSWLRYIAIVCPLDKPKHKNDHAEADDLPYTASPETCLHGQYDLRLKQLTQVARKIGPFVFNRVDSFSAKSAPDRESGSEPGYFIRTVSYPQIDNASTSAAQEWNLRIARDLVPTLGDDSDNNYDETVDYTLGVASDKVISLAWTDSIYSHGAAHGNWLAQNANWVLLPTLRPLQDGDVFGGAWRPKLEDLFVKVLNEGGWEPNDEQAEAEIRGVGSNSGRWLFTSEGLEILFNPYEGGCYACTPRVPSTISWSNLKPLLAPNSIVP